MPTIIT